MNNRLNRLAVPIGIVGIVLLLVVPVPAPLLDFLIVCNILLALLVLLTSMFVKKPLDFSVFPSLLLVATLFRLGLNVASTRLVLGNGYAGQVIEAFGKVTVGGSMIIGAVVFLILVVIQFVVVTKGAERVAEVGARFTLDAMPGKQMAIDADLNAGLLTDSQARERRAEVSAEADFYGAMDGASKFVKGDAIAGIIIIIINFVGGIAIGMVQRGLEIGDALNTYGLLTMGDGLVTQIPALLMAVSTGMIVTRSNAESDMGRTASTQLLQSPNALMIAGVAALAHGPDPRHAADSLHPRRSGPDPRLPPDRRQPAARGDGPPGRGDRAELPGNGPERETAGGHAHPSGGDPARPGPRGHGFRAPPTTSWRGSGPSGTRSRWNWAWSSRRCAPGTAWTCRPPPIRSGSPAWKPGAARPPAARCSPWATTWIRCPGPP